VVAMGSVCGTIKDTIDEMREEGIRIGLVTIVSYRPFPVDALRDALAGAKDVVVVEKSIAVGAGGPLANNVDAALRNLPRAPRLHSAVAGLGGRAITRPSLHRLFRQASVQPWEGTHFLDLNERIAGREIHRTRKTRRSGPTAENILRELAKSGVTGAE
jgi:pyruvate ferredoxin oxidoreductase alpha subunit